MTDFHPSIYPHAPGVYLFKDLRGRIIYVGKARDLRKRIGSYFRNSGQLPQKTRVMLQRAHSLDYVLTGSEKEALLLESSLIKKHKPRYNVILRDDKSYILFRLDTQSEYPRLHLTRRVRRDGSEYFGPFTSATAARQTLKAVNRLFPIRKCRDSVFRNRTRPCLQYSMGRCLAPCVKDVPLGQYRRCIRQLELFLSGRSGELLKTLRREMESASKGLDFERAAAVRDQIRAVEATVEKQSVILPQGGDVDAVGLSRTTHGLALGVVFIRRGSLLDGKSFYWESAEDPDTEQEEEAEASEGPESGSSGDTEQDRDTLRTFLTQFYTEESYIPGEIVLPCSVEDPVLEDLLSERRGGAVTLRAAEGDRDRRLLSLAEKNARQGKPELADSPLPSSLTPFLRLPRAPYRIEAIDASHLAGQGPVVGQVVLEAGRFKKDQYRQYRFGELEGSSDDYAALAGWVRRRARSEQQAPDMLLIDGGRGQLAVVERAAGEAEGRDGSLPLKDTALVALSKGEETDLVFRPGRKNPLNLKQGDPVLLFLQNIRDNAHRFVLSRQKRSRKRETFKSELESLPGIGQKTARQLWESFGSMERILRLTRQDLEQLSGFGPKRAEKVLEGIRRSEIGDRRSED